MDFWGLRTIKGVRRSSRSLQEQGRGFRKMLRIQSFARASAVKRDEGVEWVDLSSSRRVCIRTSLSWKHAGQLLEKSLGKNRESRKLKEPRTLLSTVLEKKAENAAGEQASVKRLGDALSIRRVLLTKGNRNLDVISAAQRIKVTAVF